MALFNVIVRFADDAERPTPIDSEQRVALASALTGMVGLGKAIFVSSNDLAPSTVFDVDVVEAGFGIRLDEGARVRLAKSVREVVRKVIFQSLRAVPSSSSKDL